MIITRNSLPYRERAGLVETRRGPLPALVPGDNGVLSYPVAPPLPNPAHLLHTQGTPPPDRGASTPWPPPREESP